jgi:hypothetical protein
MPKTVSWNDKENIVFINCVGKQKKLRRKTMSSKKSEADVYKDYIAKLEAQIVQKDEEIVQIRQQKDEEIVQIRQQKDEEIVHIRQQKDEEIVQIRQQKDEEIVHIRQQKDEEIVHIRQQKDEEIVQKDMKIRKLNEQVTLLNQQVLHLGLEAAAPSRKISTGSDSSSGVNMSVGSDASNMSVVSTKSK